MTVEFGPHASGEALERYSLGRMPDEEAAAFEEHLLLCEECQQRLQETDDFVAAVRRATTELAAEGAMQDRTRKPGFGNWLASFRPSYALAGAAVLLLVVVAGVRQFHGPARPAAVIELQSMRGGPESLSAQAPAGEDLLLRIDARGLPATEAYRVEIVNSSGSTVWTGEGKLSNDVLEVHPTRRLDAGTYWVRIHGSDQKAELLRELGLKIR